MAEDRKRKKMSRKQRRGLIIACLVLAALVIFYFADRDGFDAFMDGTMTELMGETPAVASSPAAPSEPSKTPDQQATPAPAGETPSAPPASYEGTLEVYVLDVGQGDSIFLRSPSGKTMLVDASESGDYDDVIDGFLQDEGVETLDVVLATHPHNDHIGGMWKLIRDYGVEDFYLSPETHTTATFERMLEQLEKKNVNTHYAVRGDDTTIPWDEDVTVEILSPIDGYDYNDLNDWSVIVRVSYGETAIVLTGDAEHHAETLALSALPKELFKATVLKLGHHGSSTSSSADFVDAVDPDVVIASVGEGNDYGHPHRETLDWIAARSIPFYRTDRNGTVKIVFNGVSYEITTEK